MHTSFFANSFCSTFQYLNIERCRYCVVRPEQKCFPMSLAQIEPECEKRILMLYANIEGPD